MADIANDPSRASHVRSFAKDMAALSGGTKPQDMAPTLAPAPVPPAPAPTPAPEPEKAPEPVRLGREPIPELSPSPVPPAPKPEVTPSPEPTESKEDILARLREKAAAARAVAPTAAQAPVLGDTPIPLAAKPSAPAKPAPIHTYKSDFSEHIDEKNASVFSVLAAEKDAAKGPPAEVKKEEKMNRFKLIGGGMLILLGLLGIWAAYQWSQDRSVIPADDLVPSLVFADSRREVSGKGGDLLRAIAEVAGSQVPDGNVVITYVTTASTTEKGTPFKFPEPGGVLIRALGLPAPSILLRNIDDASTVGVIHAGEETRAFFILRVSSYERTFAGMLEWEDTIARDLAPLYPSYPNASSSPLLVPPQFSDSVAASRDIRVLKDEAGRTLLVYGYRDKETLVIARSELAFTELVERLTATKGE